MKGPCWIKQWIADLAMLNEQFRNEDGTVDFAALGREEYMFRTALITGNFSKSSRAKDVYDIAKKAYDSLSKKGKKGGRPRKETTADGDIREDSLAKHDGSAITRNETRATDALGPSANLYGEAATSDAAERSPSARIQRWAYRAGYYVPLPGGGCAIRESLRPRNRPGKHRRGSAKPTACGGGLRKRDSIA